MNSHYVKIPLVLTLVGTLLTSMVPANARTLAKEPSEPHGIADATLSLPPVPKDLRLFIDELNEQLSEEISFSAIELNDGRDGFAVYWHGDLEPLEGHLRDLPKQYSVEVKPTKFVPGELKDEARRLVQSGQVIGAGVNVDASSIHVTIPDSGARSAKPVVSRFPIVSDTGDILPSLSRNDDTIGLGGAWIAIPAKNFKCSTAFGVTNNVVTGMLTAAHCADVGDAIQTAAGRSYGTVNQRSVTHDAALIIGKPGGYASGFYQNDIGTNPNDDPYDIPVFGSLNPVVNDEVCFSPAFRGLSCGHIVTYAGYTWSFPDSGMNYIQGFQTTHANSKRYIGKGDSGGPGFVLTFDDYGVAPYAATIVSGIQQSAPPGNCDSGLLEHQTDCSHIVLSTGVRGALYSFGFEILD